MSPLPSNTAPPNPQHDSRSVLHDHQSTKLVIGLTGGIGSGKTAASNWFAQQGIVIIDADVIAHEIVAKGQPTLQKIVETFGDWILTEDGELDRPALRQHVFADADNHASLNKLESITHPAIRTRISQALHASTSTYTILSAPLLLEAGRHSGLAALCQRILVIDVPETLQLQRACARDGQTEARIRAIMQKQMPRQQRLALADDVVTNDGTLEELYARLLPLHQHYLACAGA